MSACFAIDDVQKNLNDKVATVSSDDDVSALFEEWKAAFGKQQDKQRVEGIVSAPSASASSDDDDRLAVFKENVKKIKECNAAKKSYKCQFYCPLFCYLALSCQVHLPLCPSFFVL